MFFSPGPMRLYWRTSCVSCALEESAARILLGLVPFCRTSSADWLVAQEEPARAQRPAVARARRSRAARAHACGAVGLCQLPPARPASARPRVAAAARPTTPLPTRTAQGTWLQSSRSLQPAATTPLPTRAQGGVQSSLSLSLPLPEPSLASRLSLAFLEISSINVQRQVALWHCGTRQRWAAPALRPGRGRRRGFSGERQAAAAAGGGRRWPAAGRGGFS